MREARFLECRQRVFDARRHLGSLTNRQTIALEVRGLGPARCARPDVDKRVAARRTNDPQTSTGSKCASPTLSSMTTCNRAPATSLNKLRKSALGAEARAAVRCYSTRLVDASKTEGFETAVRFSGAYLRSWGQSGNNCARIPGKTKGQGRPASKTSQQHRRSGPVCKTSIPGSNPGGASNS